MQDTGGVMEYHDDYSSIGRSMLKLFCESPLIYKHTYITRKMPPVVPSKTMIEGTVRHGMALEGKSIDDSVRVYPRECFNEGNTGLVGARAKAFREENKDFLCLKQSEYDETYGAANAILNHPELSEIIKRATAIERRFDAMIEGLPVKVKPDILLVTPRKVRVWDLKFPKKLVKGGFERTGKRLGYWMQDSFYAEALESIFKKPVEFKFLSVESQFPNRISENFYSPQSREEATTFHRCKLRELRACMESGKFADDWNPEVILSPYDMQQSDNDLVEVE